MQMLSSMVIKRCLSSYVATNKLPKHMEDFFKERSTDCYDTIFNSRWKVISAPEDQGTCLVELKVDDTLANVKKVIHGGAIASLVDMVTTAALYNTPTRKPGISVDIHLSYIKTAKLNQNILIEGKVLRSGQKLAYLAANVYLKDNDSYDLKKNLLVASASHTKLFQ